MCGALLMSFHRNRFFSLVVMFQPNSLIPTEVREFIIANECMVNQRYIELHFPIKPKHGVLIHQHDIDVLKIKL